MNKMNQFTYAMTMANVLKIANGLNAIDWNAPKTRYSKQFQEFYNTDYRTYRDKLGEDFSNIRHEIEAKMSALSATIRNELNVCIVKMRSEDTIREIKELATTPMVPEIGEGR